MSSICYDLERTLARLDPGSASALERLVRDSLALVETRETAQELDARGWPRGYFENTAGSLAGEPLDAPEDPPAKPLPAFVSDEEVRLMLAVKLFETGPLSLGQAAEMSGYSKQGFMEVLTVSGL